MHHKNIKAIVRKQLKVNYRHWNILSKKAKKRIAKKVLEEVNPTSAVRGFQIS